MTCACESPKDHEWKEGRRGMYTAMRKNQRMFKIIQQLVIILFLLAAAAAWIALGL